MKKLVFLLILSVFLASCDSKQQKNVKAQNGKTEIANGETNKVTSTVGECMWKIASYAGDLGDNKNATYLTNTFALWGSVKNDQTSNTELKVKFLIDKVSFCIKLYENGTKIVKKGDESLYKITIKSAGGEPYQISAKNVSDRIFINDLDAKKIIESFNKGGGITFTMVTDSKTAPSSYSFTLDHPEGFGDLYKKL
jgi:hypothetical protein